jgi:UDP-N-acetylmuramate dehydrogenase
MLIQNNVSLKQYNTFGVDIQAAYFAEIHTEQDILDLIGSDVFASTPHLIL